MELVKGGEVFDKIVEMSNYSETDARNLIKNLLQVLILMHKNNIMHRDLKPENLLLKHTEDNISDIKVADFGIAVEIKDAAVGLFGSPGYMAPEMLLKKKYDEKIDIWSAGVILYILLCGTMPFDVNERRDFHVAFGGNSWKDISDNAKDVVKNMLEIDAKKRKSASEILLHPWFMSKSVSVLHLSNIHNQLKSFNAKRKLKRGINVIIAINKFAKLGKLFSGTKAENQISTSTENKISDNQATPTSQKSKKTTSPRSNRTPDKIDQIDTSNLTPRKRKELEELNAMSNSFFKDRSSKKHKESN